MEFGLDKNGLFISGELTSKHFIQEKKVKKFTLKSEVYKGISSKEAMQNKTVMIYIILFIEVVNIAGNMNCFRKLYGRK